MPSFCFPDRCPYTSGKHCTFLKLAPQVLFLEDIVAFWATAEVCMGGEGLQTAPFLWHGLWQRRHG